MKILFLDIDGVCNNHAQMHNFYCGIDKDKIELLNQIIAATQCKIVISSAWRYMVLSGEMTCKGFEYMLITHGLSCPPNTIIGTTNSDLYPKTRGSQISQWLYEHPDVDSYVVVDDLELDIKMMGHSFVQTDGKVGLTANDAAKIIKKLGEVKEV